MFRHLRPWCTIARTCTLRSLSSGKVTAPASATPPYTFFSRHSVLPIQHKYLTHCQSHTRRLCHNQNDSATVGQIKPSINLLYRCTVCETQNSHIISRHAYEKGVVIVTCEGCRNRHLIADNLNWFEDIKEKNIEEIMAKKGEIALRVKNVPGSHFEFFE